MILFKGENFFDNPSINCILGISIGGSSDSSESSARTQIDSTRTSDQQTTAEQTGTTTTTGTQRQTSRGTTTGEKTSDLSEQEVLSLLDEDTQNFLRSFIADIGGGDAYNEHLTRLLETRALEADTVFGGLVDEQVDEARRLSEIELGQQVQALTRATGGGAGSNSLVAGFDLEGQQAINTSIASLAATLGIDSRQAGTEEITNAIQVATQDQQTQVGSMAALAEVLKGASATSTKVVSGEERTRQLEDVVSDLQSAQTENEVMSILENLIGTETLTGTETSAGSTRSKGFNIGGSFGI